MRPCPPGNLNAYCHGAPLDCGNESILLIDEATVADRWGVRRVLNPPIKDPRNPLMVPDSPWEGNCGQPTVIHDESANLYRMWYSASDWNAWVHQFRLKDWNAKRHGYPYFVCYAESRDGAHWGKPALEGKPYLRHDKTNVVLTGVEKAQAPRVILTPPSLNRPERFLMTYKDNLPEGMGAFCLAYSDDGVNWVGDERNPVFIGAQDTWQNMLYDPHRKQWLLYTRPTTHAGVPDYPGGPSEGNFKRRVAVMIGDSPYDFGPPRMVMWPDEADQPDFDHMVVSRVGSHFLGFLAQMSPPPRMEFTIHLAFSSDGVHWNQLPDRSAYLPHGGPGAFDAGSTSCCGGVVAMGDDWHVYYRGGIHGQAQGNKNNQSCLGRAKFLRDRFVAQAAGAGGGFLLTREMMVTGPELIVNTTVPSGYEEGFDGVDAAVPAEFACEILTPNGFERAQPIPGFELANCETRAIDLLDNHVTWKDKKDLGDLMGKPVIIRFYLKNCFIYSLRFQE